MISNLKVVVSWSDSGIPGGAQVAFRDGVEPHEVVDALLALSGELGKTPRPRIDTTKS